MSPEMFSLLVLALFAAAAAGWFVARHVGRARPVPGGRQLSAQYLKGLNFVLSEEPDKALEVFLRMVEVDNDTVETHFALGSLYRRRGEVDRATRVHENVIARPGLEPEHREHAIFALGEDYFRAGLYDRAEKLFSRLADDSGRRVGALRYLIRIYEQQRDWEQAISTHQKLDAIAAPEHPTAIAHYFCELAELARQRADYDSARDFLRQARREQRNFPRSALLRADVALDMEDAPSAVRLCRRVIDLHPQLMPLALPKLALALRTEGGDAALARGLGDFARASSARRAEIAYAAIVTGSLDEPFMLECVRDFVREDPNLGDLVPALAADPLRLDEAALRSLGAALGRIFRRTQRFRCVECGFASATHFWQCPGCRSWDALAPVARLELSPAARGR